MPLLPGPFLRRSRPFRALPKRFRSILFRLISVAVPGYPFPPPIRSSHIHGFSIHASAVPLQIKSKPDSAFPSRSFAVPFRLSAWLFCAGRSTAGAVQRKTVPSLFLAWQSRCAPVPLAAMPKRFPALLCHRGSVLCSSIAHLCLQLHSLSAAFQVASMQSSRSAALLSVQYRRSAPDHSPPCRYCASPSRSVAGRGGSLLPLLQHLIPEAALSAVPPLPEASQLPVVQHLAHRLLVVRQQQPDIKGHGRPRRDTLA